MSQGSEQASGIPMRAIHEAWMDMMRALQEYYQAENLGSDQELDQARSRLQHQVLGCYELLRPYLRSNDSVSQYWDGKPPGYQSGDGVSILSWQDHPQPVPVSKIKWPDDTEAGLEFQDLHQQLGLGADVRITDYRYEENETNGDVLFLRVRVFELGLKKLDTWHNTRNQVERSKNGFLKGETETEVVTSTVSGQKLVRAARSLQNALEELDLLVEVSDGLPFIREFDQSQPGEETARLGVGEVGNPEI